MATLVWWCKCSAQIYHTPPFPTPANLFIYLFIFIFFNQAGMFSFNDQGTHLSKNSLLSQNKKK